MFGVAVACFLAIEAALLSGVWSRESRGWGLFVLLTVAAALCTPNGIAGFLQPFRLMAMSELHSQFSEWRAANFQSFEPLEPALLGMILLGFTTGLKLPLPRLILLLALCHMALASARHAELLGLVGPLAIAGSFGPAIAAKLRSLPVSAFSRCVNRLPPSAGGPAVALAMAIAVGLSLPVMAWPLLRTDDAVTPASALAAASRMGLAGPVFNSESFGGYLTFRGVPPLIDGRMELYGDAFLERHVAAENGNPQALEAILDRYGITWTVIAPDRGALLRLDGLTGWQRVYTDAFAVIHSRVMPRSR
jgi:hypothetical protein